MHASCNWIFFSDQDSRSIFLSFPHKKVEDYIAVKEFSQTINEMGIFLIYKVEKGSNNNS